MEELLAILTDLDPDIDYEHEEHLIDNGILDSMLLLDLVAEIEDTYGVTITPAELVPSNFNSYPAMWKMIEGLRK